MGEHAPRGPRSDVASGVPSPQTSMSSESKPGDVDEGAGGGLTLKPDISHASLFDGLRTPVRRADDDMCDVSDVDRRRLPSQDGVSVISAQQGDEYSDGQTWSDNDEDPEAWAESGRYMERRNSGADADIELSEFEDQPDNDLDGRAATVPVARAAGGLDDNDDDQAVDLDALAVATVAKKRLSAKTFNDRAKVAHQKSELDRGDGDQKEEKNTRLPELTFSDHHDDRPNLSPLTTRRNKAQALWRVAAAKVKEQLARAPRVEPESNYSGAVWDNNGKQIAGKRRASVTNLPPRKRSGRLSIAELVLERVRNRKTVVRAPLAQSKGILVRTEEEKAARRHTQRRVRFEVKLVEQSHGEAWWQVSYPPDSLVARLWTNCAVVSLCVYTLFKFPTRLAFGTHVSSSMHILDVVPDCLFLVDAVVCNFVGYMSIDGVEMDIGKIRDRYYRRTELWAIKAPAFYLDMLAIVPFQLAHALDGKEWMIQVAALPRLLRIRRLYLWFAEIEYDVHTDFRQMAMLKFTIYLIGMAHWVGCLWWFLARLENYNARTWVSQYEEVLGMDFGEASLAKKYHFALLWGLRSMTAFGYSDVVPDTWSECLFAIIVAALQVVFNAYILGTLFTYVVTKDEKAESYRATMKAIEAYAEARRLPAELQSRMKSHFSFILSKEASSDNDIFHQLPAALRIKVARWQHRTLEKDAAVLVLGCSEQYVSAILTRLKARFVLPGEALFKLGDMARELCFVTSGSLDEFEDAEMRRQTRSITAGVVGELAFFMGIPQPCVVAASVGSDVLLQSITKDEYDEILKLYAEGHSIVVNNIVAQYGLDSNGGEMGAADAAAGGDTTKAATVKKTEERDELFEKRRTALKQTLRRRKDDALSVMIDAAFEGDIETVRRILHQGLDVNSGDYDMRTMMHLAAAKGDLKVIKSLLDEGGDVHVMDRWGQTPLLDAVRGGHHQVAQLLVAAGAAWTDGVDNDSAAVLCNLVSDDNLDGLKYAIEYGAPPNAEDYDGRTCLHVAASQGNSAVITFLLQSQANVNAKDRWGNTPLVDAVKNLHQLPAKILYEAGGEIHNGNAAVLLCDAALKGDQAYLRLLYECGADVRSEDYDRRTPLHLAAAEGQLISVDFLLFAKADVSYTDRWGNQAIDDALRGEYYDCAKLLLAAGGEPARPLTALERARLDAVSLREVREAVRHQVLKQEVFQRKKNQIRDAIKLAQRDIENTADKFDRLAGHVEAITQHYMRRGGQEATVLSMRGDADEVLYAMPDMEGAGEAAGADPSDSGGSDAEQMARTAANFDNEVRGGKKQWGFAMQRFLGLDVPPPPQATSLRLLEMGKGGAPPSSEAGGDNKNKNTGSTATTVELSSRSLELLTSTAGKGKKAAGALLGGDRLTSLEEAASSAEDADPTKKAAPSGETGVANNKMPADPLMLASRNAHINAGREVAKFDGQGTTTKFTSFNQIILMFPTVEHGFALLREQFDECCKSRTMNENAMDSRRDLGATLAKAMPFGLNMPKKEKVVYEVSKSELHRLCVVQLGLKASRQDLAALCLVDVGLSGGEEADAIDFPLLIANESFVRLVHSAAEDPNCNPMVAALEASYRIVSSAFEMLDRSGKGQITIQELKHSIGGELKFGDELLNLFSRRYIIHRKDFLISLLRWLNIIDEDELEELNDAEELNNRGSDHDGPIKDDTNARLLQSRAGLQGLQENSELQRLRESFAYGAMGAAWEAVGSAAAALIHPFHNIEPDESEVDPYAGAAGVAMAPAPRRRNRLCALFDDIHRSYSFYVTHRRIPRFRLDSWFVELAKQSTGGSDAENADFVFRDIDKNGNGLISLFEWNAFVEATGMRLPHSKVAILFTLFAKDSPRTHAARMGTNVDYESFKQRFMLCELESQALRQDAAARHDKTKLQASAADWCDVADPRKASYVQSKLLIMPGSRVDTWFSAVSLVVAVYYILSVPYMLAFFHRPNQLSSPTNLATMYCADALLWACIVRNFFTAYYNRRSVLITDLAKIRRHYFKSSFALDFVTAVPFDLAVWVTQAPGTGVLWMRTPRLLMSRELHRHMMLRRKSLNKLKNDLQTLFYGLLILIHVLACFWHGITDQSRRNFQSRIYLDDDGEDARAARAEFHGAFGTDPKGQNNGQQLDEYLLSFYWVMSTLTSIGTAYLEPYNFQERWFSMILMVLNLSLFAYVLGTISSLFMTADAQLVAARNEITATNQFIEERRLPLELSDAIRRCSDFSGSSRAATEAEENRVFRGLSYSLQVDVARHTCHHIISLSRCFTFCSEHFLDTLSTMLREASFTAQTILFRYRDSATTLYLVSAGEVELLAGTEDTQRVREVVGAGNAISPIPFFFGMRQISTARTASQCRAFCLDREDYKRLIKLYPSQEEAIANNVLEDSGEGEGANSGKSDSGSSIGGAPSSSGASSNGGSVTAGSVSGGASNCSGDDGPGDNKSAASGQSAASALSSKMVMATSNEIQSIQSAVAKARQKREKEWIAARCAAAAEGRLADLKHLVTSLSRSTSIDAADYDGRTPLHLAASEGREDVVAWLLECGARVDVVDRFGGTPYTDAVRQKHDDVAGMLRAAGGSLEMDDKEVSVKLCAAASAGDLGQLKRILQGQDEVNSTDYDGRTAMHLAACNGHVSIIKFLLDHHADTSIMDFWGGTPLSNAIMMKQIEAQEVLRQAGAILPFNDTTGSELCDFAHAGDMASLTIMVENGSDPNLGDYDNRRALHLASCSCRLGMVEFLLSLKIDVNVVDRFGGTPLEDAIREGHYAVAMLLERHGAVRSGDATLEGRIQINIEKSRARQLEAKQNKIKDEERHTVVVETCASIQDKVATLARDTRRLQQKMQFLSLHSHPKQSKSKKALAAVRDFVLEDACSPVFVAAFRKYLRERAYAEHLLDCFVACTRYKQRPRRTLVDEVVSTYLTKHERRDVRTSPKFVLAITATLARLDDHYETRMPPDLLQDVADELASRLSKHVRKFQKSTYCRQVLLAGPGALWRILDACHIASQNAQHTHEICVGLKDAFTSDTINELQGLSRAAMIPALVDSLDDYAAKLVELKKNAERLAVGGKLLYERAAERKRVLSAAEDEARNLSQAAMNRSKAPDFGIPDNNAAFGNSHAAESVMGGSVRHLEVDQ